jgi:hypothetical protein
MARRQNLLSPAGSADTSGGVMSRAARQLQTALTRTVAEQKLRLFGIATEADRALRRHLAAMQAARYGADGLRTADLSDLPRAVDELFARMRLEPGDRLLEIGPGPHGGIGLIAALMGLHVVLVEFDGLFEVDVDRLRSGMEPGASAALTPFENLHGVIQVRPIDGLLRLVQPLRRLIAAAGGSLTIVAGDVADATVSSQALARGPFDHIVCTDVISPMGDGLRDTTAMLTTGDESHAAAILQTVARASASARSLFVGLLVPEQNPDCGARIANAYAQLEAAIGRDGRRITWQPTFSPSSSFVCRSRLYHLAPMAASADPAA